DRPPRPAAIRRRPAQHLRPGADRAARRAEAHALDVVRLPAGRRARPQRHGAAVRPGGPRRGPRLRRPPGARAAAGRVRPRAHRPRRGRPGAGHGIDRRAEAPLVDDALRARRPGPAGVPPGARPLLRRRRGRRDDQPAPAV
ncbi:MAG: NTP pyrophosphohydrolases including oxidative damage repair enzymes, partial [uncultured Blastococcus sp.]